LLKSKLSLSEHSSLLSTRKSRDFLQSSIRATPLPKKYRRALNDLYKLWSTTVLKVAVIEDATVTSASSHPEQIAAFD
jgi:hypothetical protein